MFALVDCNNFFVSCERVFRPDLEGKAVVVLSNNDGCVVARSNESKAMGIRMGTPYFQIRHLEEKGKLTVCSSNYSLYGDLSARVMSLLAEAVPKIEIYSIDEAFLHVEGISPEVLPKLCRDLVVKVRKWVGIPVSVGVAPTKTLAKIASHFAKKYAGYRGVCFIDSEERRRKALELTPVDDVWGFGRRLTPKLEALGVKTALDYADRPEEWAKAYFNLPGVRTWLELNGKVAVEEETDARRKSICTSRSFADMTESLDELIVKVSDFAAICSKKLREEGSAACQVTTFLMTNRFRDDLDQYCPAATINLPVAASSAQEIVSAAIKALRTIWRPGYQYKKAGVIVDRIVAADCIQTDLFDLDYVQRERNDKLSDVIDHVNSIPFSGGNSNLLRLATQNRGHYSQGIRSEHRSRLFSTDFEDIMEVH